MEASSSLRAYVRVNAEFREDGVMLPRNLIWEDGHKYEIDRVLKIQPAPAMKAGGQGDRYTRNKRPQNYERQNIKARPSEIWTLVCGTWTW